MTGRIAAERLLGFLVVGAALAAIGVPIAQADSITLDQRSTTIVGRAEAAVEPTSWASAWSSATERPACGPEVFADQTGDSYADFLTAGETEAELAVPLAAANQFVCFRAATAAGDWLYSNWLAVRVQAAELTVSQRHRFVTASASQPVAEDSWRGLITDGDCPDLTTINQPLRSDLVRLSSDFQLVLEVPESDDGKWLCLAAVDRAWSTMSGVSHRLSRLSEEAPAVTISQRGNQLQASAETSWPQGDWYFFKSLSQPNCQPNPIPEPGRVTDPLFDEWTAGQELAVQIAGDEEIWVCFIVLSPPDDFGNRVVGYGLYQVVNEPVRSFRGLIWLVALNGFIVCAGSAVGILLYRSHPPGIPK